MPIQNSKKRDTVSKPEFHQVLREWFETSDEMVVDPTRLDPTPVVHIKTQGSCFILHADTSRNAVAWYLNEVVEPLGNDVDWHVVENQRGRMTATAFGQDRMRNPSFYLYLHPYELKRAKQSPTAIDVQPARDKQQTAADDFGGPIPVDGAENHLQRVLQSRGTAERNIEDVVREFFVLLGHEANAITFQTGRIDITVTTASGPMVVEVKKTLGPIRAVKHAQRQAFDYANEVNAALVVITDGDEYHVYDRTNLGSYDDMKVGSFSLSKWRQEDATTLDHLRPKV